MNTLYQKIMGALTEKTDSPLKSEYHISEEMSEKIYVIPPARVRYLSEIAESNRGYDQTVEVQVEVAQKLYGIFKTLESVTGTKIGLTKNGLDEDALEEDNSESNASLIGLLKKEFDRVKMDFDPYNWEEILKWDDTVKKYQNPVYTFKVRDKEIK